MGCVGRGGGAGTPLPVARILGCAWGGDPRAIETGIIERVDGLPGAPPVVPRPPGPPDRVTSSLDDLLDPKLAISATTRIRPAREVAGLPDEPSNPEDWRPWPHRIRPAGRVYDTSDVFEQDVLETPWASLRPPESVHPDAGYCCQQRFGRSCMDVDGPYLTLPKVWDHDTWSSYDLDYWSDMYHVKEDAPATSRGVEELFNWGWAFLGENEDLVRYVLYLVFPSGPVYHGSSIFRDYESSTECIWTKITGGRDVLGVDNRLDVRFLSEGGGSWSMRSASDWFGGHIHVNVESNRFAPSALLGWFNGYTWCSDQECRDAFKLLACIVMAAQILHELSHVCDNIGGDDSHSDTMDESDSECYPCCPSYTLENTFLWAMYRVCWPLLRRIWKTPGLLDEQWEEYGESWDRLFLYPFRDGNPIVYLAEE